MGGDVITASNGVKTTESSQLRNLIAMTAKDTSVRLDVRRAGRERTLEVKLGEQPAERALHSPRVTERGARIAGAVRVARDRALLSRVVLPDSTTQITAWCTVCRVRDEEEPMATMQGNGNRNQGSQQGGGQQAGQQRDQQGGQQGQQGESTQMARRQPQQGAIARPMRRSRALSPFGLSPLSVFSASPFSMVRRVFDDMERIMESMMPEMDEGMGMDMSSQGQSMTGPSMMGQAMGLDFIPRIDVTRRDDKLVVHADLPGLSPDQVRVYASDDGGLVIEGERRTENERREGEIWQTERSYGRFYRVIPLPDGVDFESEE
ncbi:MAG: Hsp20 family protein, partial [Deltaproteobacteria bacterium]|nr:Hsp20 family protein [Deltaproteobacteria bacterium]